MKDPQLGTSIVVSQERAIEELEAIPVKKNIEEDLCCTPTMHAKYRSLLGLDKLVTKQDTVPVLLQVFQMCFKGQHLQQLVTQKLHNKLA